MSVTISDGARALLELAKEKEKLQTLALRLNAHTQELTDNFHRMIKETSVQQKEILERIAELDDTVLSVTRILGGL
jgi:predicted transcriptional regulator